MSRLRVSRAAIRDLDEIWLYVAEHDGIGPAQRYIENLTSRFALLASTPNLGRARDELKIEIRSHPVGEHVIYYRHAKSVLTILRVFHGARDIKKLLSDLS